MKATDQCIALWEAGGSDNIILAIKFLNSLQNILIVDFKKYLIILSI
jgi:hypothetical protein